MDRSRIAHSVGLVPIVTGEQQVPQWIDDDGDLQALVKEISAEPAYAIDTEFHREKTYYPKLALVQIAWPSGLALIDPFACDIGLLGELFATSAQAIFHAADQDLEVLQQSVGSVPQRMFDTQLAAGFLGFSTPSLVTLAERVLGISLSKGDRLTDWTRRPLSEAQQRYAASDVAHLFELRDRLTEQLVLAERLAWVEEETELSRLRPRGMPNAERAWWKLKDVRVLRGRDRLAAQELCMWREAKAQRQDIPSRFVLPDMCVLAIAQAKPTNMADLGSVRGIDGRYIKGSAGPELLDAVQRAGELPTSALVVPEPEEFDKRLRPAVTLIGAWIAQLARDVRIDAALLATRHDLVSFLKGDLTARLSHGWRHEIVGVAVSELVSGEAALAFETGGALMLERRSRVQLQASVLLPTATWTDDLVTESAVESD